MLGLCLLGSAIAVHEPPHQFSEDFTRAKGPSPAWNLFGYGPGQDIRPSEGGLRITLARNRKTVEPAGLSPCFSISGDFQITLGYEILAVQEPEKGYGAGVNLLVRLNAPEPESETVKLSHLLRKGNRNVYFLDYKVGAKTQYESKTFPTALKKGRLGIKRQGTSLSYLVGSAGNDWKELYKTVVSTSDVRNVRAVANTGGSDTFLDVQFAELRVDATSLLNAPQPPDATSPISWWLWASPPVVLFTSAAVIIIWRRKRSKSYST